MDTIQQIVTFEGSKVHHTLPHLPEKPYKVISIIGQVRQGKSTFMNCIVSYINQTNMSPFKTSDEAETCTRGINMYICGEYILLDCHGLSDATSRSDSKNDPALLLLVYGMSDVIIHNVQAMNNATVKELEALTVFLNEFDTPNKKPTLVFRVKDYRLKESINKLTEKTFVKSNDQYDSIKGTIMRNFERIESFSTKLSDADFEALDESNYLKIIRNSRNGVKKTIEQILELATNSMLYSDFTKAVNVLSKEINEGRINIKMLDVVEMHHENMLTSYENELRKNNPELWVQIPASPFQSEFVAVENLSKQIHEELSKYRSKFNKINSTLLNKFHQRLETELMNVLRETEKTFKAAVDEKWPSILHQFNSDVCNHIADIQQLDNTEQLDAWHAMLQEHLTMLISPFVTIYIEPYRIKALHNLAQLVTKLKAVAKTNAYTENVILSYCYTQTEKFNNPAHMVNGIELATFQPFNTIIQDFIGPYCQTYHVSIKEFVNSQVMKKVNPMNNYTDEPIFSPYTYKLDSSKLTGEHLDVNNLNEPLESQSDKTKLIDMIEVVQTYISKKERMINKYMTTNEHECRTKFTALTEANKLIRFVALIPKNPTQEYFLNAIGQSNYRTYASFYPRFVSAFGMVIQNFEIQMMQLFVWKNNVMMFNESSESQIVLERLCQNKLLHVVDTPPTNLQRLAQEYWVNKSFGTSDPDAPEYNKLVQKTIKEKAKVVHIDAVSAYVDEYGNVFSEEDYTYQKGRKTKLTAKQMELIENYPSSSELMAVLLNLVQYAQSHAPEWSERWIAGDDSINTEFNRLVELFTYNVEYGRGYYTNIYNVSPDTQILYKYTSDDGIIFYIDNTFTVHKVDLGNMDYRTWDLLDLLDDIRRSVHISFKKLEFSDDITDTFWPSDVFNKFVKTIVDDN